MSLRDRRVDPRGEDVPPRERILRAAGRLFAERGYPATTTQDIAKVVGVREPSLFLHFTTTQAIAKELLTLAMDEPTAFVRDLAHQQRPAAVRLYRGLRFDAEHLCRSPYVFFRLVSDTVLRLPEFAPWRRRAGALRDALRSLVDQGIASGEFDADAEFAVQALEGLRLNTIRLHAEGRAPADTYPDRLASFALRALLADPSQVEEIRREAAEGSPQSKPTT